MEQPKGLIAWFAHNSVAANLLMLIIIIGGLFSAVMIKKEMMPTYDINQVQVSVAYPGAAPQDIEDGIVIKVEEAIKEIDGIKKISSVAGDGIGSVNIEVSSGFDVFRVLDEIKLAVDAIATFPANIEKPTIQRIKPINSVIWVSIYGDISKKEIKEITKSVRDDLAAFPEITKLTLRGTPAYEVAIEISESKLKQYNLSFEQVAQAVQKSSLDLPGGAIRAQGGDILLRTKSQAYTQDDFERIVVRTGHDGSRVMLSQVADIKDGFEEGLFYTRFNAKPAAIIEVMSVDDQNAIAIADQVRQYIDNKQATLPKGVSIDYWGDLTHYLKDRLNMMLLNLFYGALLVFLLLAFFLDVKLAFWVMVGIPVCFLGAIFLMPHEPFDLSINMITLFGFLLVLGIVVDDAIVIGESVYSEIESKGHSVSNVISGAKSVAMPATFGVLTTMVAFTTLLMGDGFLGSITSSIGLVIILCLLFSLIESKLILPAHLAQMSMKLNRPPKTVFGRTKQNFHQGMMTFISDKYRPFIKVCIKQRYVVLALFILLGFLAKGMKDGGAVREVFFPNLPSDFISVNVEMEKGTSEQHTLDVIQEIEDALYRVNTAMEQEYGYQILAHSQVDVYSNTSAFLFAELIKGESREANADMIAKAWREKLPKFVGVKKLSIDGSTAAGGGADIAFSLVSTDLNQLTQAANELKYKLAEYQGVYGIGDNLSSGSQEVRLQIRPEAEALGLSLSDLARQVRYGFYGYETQRILRDNEEVKVMVRYPAEHRKTMGHLENMMIRTPQGETVPFNTVAQIDIGESMALINRTDGQRAISVEASVDKTQIEPSKIVGEIQAEFIPQLLQKYPKLTTSLTGASLDEQEAKWQFLLNAIFVCLAIYALMAIPLKSYTQPILILIVAPFGIIGAIFGHWVHDASLSILSWYGILALSGVVVNDALVLVDYINKSRARGISVFETAVDAGCRRFRAIVLTSLTTFVGLVPILLEKSLQAAILIPMAISLAYGIVFATLVTLVLMPALYVIFDDIKKGSHWLFNWWWQPQH
ncbi:efflux RND transporter permease subunit [Parashewanella spongiae]|uniref:Efflux RND transporter permease subunit n=1 Tax=Parashewanella spongiae TaxID=342950 RepID=A0A3A6U4D0_9GAMM|nr:efflux RND transporter permease subunit [Parashewanella spongiae]MCL1076937.1 efflux RND transporter permease subunit [Parashewanella spongiae]RJY18946.1 efflux RND transporter permease subunit [Parashewanella spongiae]